MISEPTRLTTLADLHAGAKDLYLALCSYHVENADLTPALAEVRDKAEEVALKIGAVIRSKANGARLDGEA